MGTYYSIKVVTVYCLFTGICALGASDTSAQRAELLLDLQINESLANAQVINITNLFTGRGNGSGLFTLFIKNENISQPAGELYFNIRFRSGKNGLLAHLYQKQGHPFSLQPGQQVYAAGNTIRNGLPGVEADIRFDGGLTGPGRQFFNGLGGITKLPPDRYSVQIDVFQGSNSRNGGIWVVSAEAELGDSMVEDVRDIYLTSPGGAMGSEVELVNAYPEFRWEGIPGTGYRLIVVEAKGRESPESLLQGALSTEPEQVGGISGMGTLLDYEILDIRLNRTSFQFPSSGVQALEPGGVYYWQVLSELSSSNGTDVRTSEIWSFSLTGPNGQQSQRLDGELSRLLKQLLGDSQYSELQQGGFRLESLIIDGEEVTGTSALQRLTELEQKLDQGEISIVVD